MYSSVKSTTFRARRVLPFFGTVRVFGLPFCALGAITPKGKEGYFLIGQIDFVHGVYFDLQYPVA